MGPPPLTRNESAPCGGFILPIHYPSAAAAADSPYTLLENITSSGGGEVGNAHEFEQNLLSFAVSDLSCHLLHVSAKRTEATEGLIALLYDRFDGRISRLDLERIFIAMGPGGRRQRRKGRSTISVK